MLHYSTHLHVTCYRVVDEGKDTPAWEVGNTIVDGGDTIRYLWGIPNRVAERVLKRAGVDPITQFTVVNVPPALAWTLQDVSTRFTGVMPSGYFSRYPVLASTPHGGVLVFAVKTISNIVHYPGIG